MHRLISKLVGRHKSGKIKSTHNLASSPFLLFPLFLSVFLVAIPIGLASVPMPHWTLEYTYDRQKIQCMCVVGTNAYLQCLNLMMEQFNIYWKHENKFTEWHATIAFVAIADIFIYAQRLICRLNASPFTTIFLSCCRAMESDWAIKIMSVFFFHQNLTRRFDWSLWM